jgi:hypothetical protein
MTTDLIENIQARFAATWSVAIALKPGSVPDRLMPYSSAGASYRPESVRLVFRTSAWHGEPYALKLENGSGFMRTARESVKLDIAEICGPRLRKNGEPGQHIVTETIYDTSRSPAPGWLPGITAVILADLT